MVPPVAVQVTAGVTLFPADVRPYTATAKVSFWVNQIESGTMDMLVRHFRGTPRAKGGGRGGLAPARGPFERPGA